ncbi:MAG TPA: 4'-phosphopantetheinyl transferase superfamily protein, partial [Puia sp.]
MPLFYQHNINPGTKLGIWHIGEPETFFLQKVPLKKDVSHPFKRLQHLAGRYLLTFLFPDFPLEDVQIADTRKPFLENEKYHFSISHCGAFAAAIVSRDHRVGVDIESIKSRIRGLSHKFMGTDEATIIGKNLSDEWMTLLWSAKESLFKWYGRGEVDFKRHMHLQEKIGKEGEWLQMPFLFNKEAPVHLTVEAR